MKIILNMMSVVMSLFGFCLVFDIGVNFTPSLARGLYIKNNEEIQYNDIVQFCLDNEIANKVQAERYTSGGSCENGLKPLLKYVVGMEGDKIEIRENRVFITQKNKEESVFYGIIQEIDSKNNQVLSLLKDGTIPQNQVYVFSNHKGSFDSRYFGLINIENLTHMETLLVF